MKRHNLNQAKHYDNIHNDSSDTDNIHIAN